QYAVDWNGPATSSPRLRLLLLADVDLASAGSIVEWAIQGGKAIDLCAVCGDFIPRPEGWSEAGETEEQLSAEEGEMSAILGKRLENTVCRVVYVPGPLDPVIPSIRLARSQRVTGSQGASREGGASGPGGGIPRLTPTSKNMFRRNLRLAPGLSTAGFTEEAIKHPAGGGVSGSSSSSNSSNSSNSRDSGGAEGGDETSATLRSLCRSGGGGSSNNTKSASPESVILLTRLGGVRRRPQGGGCGAGAATVAASHAPGDDDGAGAGGGNATAAEAEAATAAAMDETVTAARLRQLWVQEGQQAADVRKKNNEEDGGGGGTLLLHVCSGPGAFLAVHEALSEGGAGQQLQHQHGQDPAAAATAAAMSSSAAGIGCRVGGCTVVALGSLREHGAYCVVELAVPLPSGGTRQWSVASVDFGRIESFDEEKEAVRRRLARGRTEFVLNFDE
ncbi:unnamed protein product, partial [Pylaiella littoralis]